jgi:hypothetical protein
MSICRPPQTRWPTDLLPEFLRTAQQIPSANNSSSPVTMPKLQPHVQPRLPPNRRDRIPRVIARLTPSILCFRRAPKNPAPASPFIEIRLAQMRNDPHALIFTQFRKSQHCVNFRLEATSPRTEPLRFFRDLIIFRENPARMRRQARLECFT